MKNIAVPYVAIPRKPLRPTAITLKKSKKKSWPVLLSVLFLAILILTSCALFPGAGSASKAESKGRNQISNVESKIAANTTGKLDTIAEFAYGTDYALSKVNEPPREVTVARDINQRVISLSGSPTIEKMKEMQATIDKLTSVLELERNDGKKKLDAKDLEIATLQNATKELVVARDAEIRKYMQVAQDTAADRDAYKAELNKMDAYGGLGAIWYGVKRLVIRLAWVLGIGSVLFIVLRIFAASNPIAGAIFGIFNVIAGYMIRIINVIVPKAIEFSGHIATSAYNSSKLLLTKIVDNIQNLKELEKKLGRDITVKELFVELDKSLDVAEKEIIAKIKKDLGYN